MLWNGPMGVFEFPAFAVGTNALAKTVAHNQDATTIVGGGDSVSAIHQSGFADQITHISTGARRLARVSRRKSSARCRSVVPNVPDASQN